MMRLKYLLVIVTLLSGTAWLLHEYVPRYSDGSLCLGCVFIVIVLTLSAFISQKWTALAAFSLLLVGSIVGERWRYLLAVVALASWLAMHLLNYVSEIADWFVDPFKACWIALFFLASSAALFRRWRELAICCLTLFVTFSAFVGVLLGPEGGGLLPNPWLQETGFRIYASHLIRSTALEEFLSNCNLIDYLEEDGARQQVGECNKSFRSTLWFEMIVIYDPSGQLARPAIQRTLAWRLAVLHLPTGNYFVHDDVASHLARDFYWILVPGPL
jgi:hypothetical protein